MGGSYYAKMFQIMAFVPKLTSVIAHIFVALIVVSNTLDITYLLKLLQLGNNKIWCTFGITQNTTGRNSRPLCCRK